MDEYLLNQDQRIWVPQKGPQAEAYYCKADELFYGGAQGGGKSDLIIGLAATQHHTSIIFRREFPRCRALIERSRGIFNPLRIQHSRDLYNESLHRWSFPDGRMVEFGALEHDKDKEDYRGRPHDLYCFDEATEFTEAQYRFVIAWCRSTIPGQRCRVVATGNPPTTMEGQWVIRYWSPWLSEHHPNPAEPGELRWFAQMKNEKGDTIEREFMTGDPIPDPEILGHFIQPTSRTFIPALLADNPILEQTGYRRKLQALPEPLRSQALYGDFKIGLTDDAWQVIPTEWVRAAQRRWAPDGGAGKPLDALGVDVAYGGADKTVISPRRGNWFGPLVKYVGKQATATQAGEGEAAAALIYKEHSDRATINIDAIGYGAAAYESLKRFMHLAKSSHINPVNSAQSLNIYDRSRRFRLVNVRAALYWKLREALDPVSGDDLSLPPDPELLSDLCSCRYELTTAGIKIEPKEDVIERIGHSPDCGDAVVLANWYRSGSPSVPDPELVANIQRDMDTTPSQFGMPTASDEELFGPDEPQARSSGQRRRGFFGN